MLLQHQNPKIKPSFLLLMMFSLMLLLAGLHQLLKLLPKTHIQRLQRTAMPHTRGPLDKIPQPKKGLALPVARLHIIRICLLRLPTMQQRQPVVLQREVASRDVPVNDFLNRPRPTLSGSYANAFRYSPKASANCWPA